MLNTMMNKMNQKLPNIQDNVSDSETFIPEHMGNALSQNIPGGMRDGHNFSPFNEPGMYLRSLMPSSKYVLFSLFSF